MKEKKLKNMEVMIGSVERLEEKVDGKDGKLNKGN